MGTVSHTCPFCRTQAVSFVAVYEWESKGQGKRTLMTCGHCREGIIREFTSRFSPVSLGGDMSAHVSFGLQWPEPREGTAPRDTPDSVARFFEQGTSSLESGNYDAAGMVFRKALEVATKSLDEELAGKKLVQRIDLLKERGTITADLAQWAHEIRLGGNEAAHEDEPFSSQDCEELRNFIEAFLKYVFTLPSAVRRRSSNPSED